MGTDNWLYLASDGRYYMLRAKRVPGPTSVRIVDVSACPEGETFSRRTLPDTAVPASDPFWVMSDVRSAVQKLLEDTMIA